MTLILKQLFSFIKILNSDTGENQVAAGIACGLILGFAPALSLQSFLVFIIIFLFRIQVGAALVSAFFFSIIAFLLDPLFDIVGGHILEIGALQGLYTVLYNMPIIPFTKFYNSIVMGAGVISIILFPVMFFLGKKFVSQYRNTILTKIQNTKAYKALKATTIYKWYAKYDELYG